MASLSNARVDNCDIQFHASAVLSISATTASFIAKLSRERRICRNYQDGWLEFVNPDSDNTDSFIRVFWTAGRINCPVEEINVWVHVMVYYFIGSEIATQLCKQRFYLRGYCTVSFK